MQSIEPTVNHRENIVEVENVSFSYGNHCVLHGVNLSIHRGDYLAIVGGNGSGKTTLLKLILGLLAPQTGAIRLFGQSIQDFKERWRIGYVPQKVTHFDMGFPASVLEVVLMGRYGRRGLFSHVTDEDRDAAQRALVQVGMGQDADRLIGDLSGGQQQRVFIARALAGEPEVIFLDEPTVGVEQQVKNEFYALLKKLNEELHLTVILITHDIESVGTQAMHVACIDKTVFFHTSVDDYLRSTHKPSHPHS